MMVLLAALAAVGWTLAAVGWWVAYMLTKHSAEIVRKVLEEEA